MSTVDYTEAARFSAVQKLFPSERFISEEVYASLRDDNVAADRFFFRLYLAHWAVATFLVSLYHGTYLLGFFGGGAIVGLSYAAQRMYAGERIARIVNGACMMLFSALFIQQSGGRIEMHFHVFSGLGMLVRYKDLAPSATAAGVIAAHHVLFNYCQQFGWSVLGSDILIFDYGTGLDIVLLHAAFVIAGVAVNSFIVQANVLTFVTSSQLAVRNRAMTDQVQAALDEAEAGRAREAKQAEGLRQKVDALLQTVDQASAGNLAARVSVVGDDAVGRVGSGLAGLLTDLKGSIGSIADHAQTLTSASHQLSSVSQQLEADAQESTDRASLASGRAATMDAAIQSVASATEELAASIAEVASHAQRADDVTETAAQLISRSNGIMAELSQAGQEIGNVMQMINQIAAQTNLLALNATIEAASAGDAGRGFAVVAAEVKTLADDTGKATEGVRGQVEAIRARTTEAAEAMAEIERVMAEVRVGSRTIASTASEQRVAADQISEAVAEAAMASSEISRTMQDMGKTASNTSEGAVHTRGSANQLVEMAAGLDALVGRFRLA